MSFLIIYLKSYLVGVTLIPLAIEAARTKVNKTWRADRSMASTEVKRTKCVSIYIGEFPYLELVF